MKNNTFSSYKEAGGVQLKGVTKPFRRIAHSARDWGKSQHPIDAIRRKPVSTAHNVVDTAATTTGVVAIGTSVALLAGSTAAFAVAVGGPQVAITLGVVALAGVVKGTYSNRDNAHRKLQPYVWTLIDDERPAQNIWSDQEALKKAASAAAYLLKQAGSQYEQMGNKLSQAQEKFNVFWGKYQRQVAPLTVKKNGEWVGKTIMDAWKSGRNAATKENQALYDEKILEGFEVLNKAKINADKMWADANKQGNEVFEFMRRLIHVGNYIQCAGIVEQATFISLNGQGVTDPGDVLLRWQGAKDYRKSLKEISDIVEEVESNYAQYEKFIQVNNIK